MHFIAHSDIKRNNLIAPLPGLQHHRVHHCSVQLAEHQLHVQGLVCALASCPCTCKKYVFVIVRASANIGVGACVSVSMSVEVYLCQCIFLAHVRS